MLKAHLARFGSELQPEAGLHQRKTCGARPSLRRTSYWIHRRPAATPRKTAEQLRETSRFPVRGRAEQAGKNLQHCFFEPIARHSERDHCIVVRPHRAVVI